MRRDTAWELLHFGKALLEHADAAVREEAIAYARGKPALVDEVILTKLSHVPVIVQLVCGDIFSGV